MKLRMRLAVAALLTIALSSAAAYADTITFTLANTTGFINVTGGSYTFAATVSAPASNSAPVFLNGDSFNMTAPLTLNDNDFFNNFPLSLSPGGSFTGNLFVVSAAPGTPFGTYLGTFTLEGGANGGSSDPLGTVSFSVVMTPEPSSIMLLLTGMGGVAMTLRRARFNGRLRGKVG